MLAALVLSVAPAIAKDTQRPNVVLVYFDDLNDWLAPFAQTQSITPNLTAFAQRSTIFLNAQTASPVCNPSRVAMLTGVHPTVSGVYDNAQVFPKLDHWISSARNLPQHFRDNGYLAAGYGKIFHHRHVEAYADADHWTPGYYNPWSDAEESALTGAAIYKYELPALQRDWGMLGDDWDRDEPARMQQDTRNTLRAIDFLDEAHDGPFFLALGIYRPHTNWYVAKRYWDKFPAETVKYAPGMLADDLADVPAHGRYLALDAARGEAPEAYADFANLPEIAERSGKSLEVSNPYLMQHGLYAEAARAYLASIAYADDMFGRFIRALEASRYAENTIVLVVSDHGYHLGEKDHWHKATLWERSVRVPLMIRAPGEDGLVAQVEQPVSLLDVYPTLVELAGLSAPSHALGGQSLVKLMHGERPAQASPILTTLYPGYHSVRDARFRYIRYPDNSRELYDLAADQWEWNNLADEPEYAATIARLDAVIPEDPEPRAD